MPSWSYRRSISRKHTTRVRGSEGGKQPQWARRHQITATGPEREDRGNVEMTQQFDNFLCHERMRRIAMSHERDRGEERRGEERRGEDVWGSRGLCYITGRKGARPGGAYHSIVIPQGLINICLISLHLASVK